MSMLGTLFAPLARSSALKLMQRGRTDEQQAIIKYFLSDGGCLSSFTVMKDKDFDKLLYDAVSSIDMKGKALAKLGLDPTQVGDVNPIYLDGYYFNPIEVEKGNILLKMGRDDLTRCSSYELTCLLFGREQLYAYSYKFSMINLEVLEEASEFFYSDIDSVEVETKVKEKLLTGKGCTGSLNWRYETNTFLTLKVSVPGNSFICSVRPENEQSLMGLKHLIRDRKSK